MVKEVMDEGDRLAERVEWQFAHQFEDFKDMSTMIGVTGGASCSDMGITKEDCKSQVAESVKS